MIKKGQSLYYVGFGWGIETHCYDIYFNNEIAYVVANNGVTRKVSDVENNACDLYVSKDAANEKLSNSWRASLI
jgi:hypothetical protein